MSLRYAVLWGLDEATSVPVGIAVEQDGYVLVDVPEHFCIPARHRGEYRVVEPDGTPVTYRPGDEGYFEQLLIDLSRTFAIGERHTLAVADPISIAELLKEKVLDPLKSMRIGRYSPTRTLSGTYRHQPDEV